jgi:hypothetical protein
LVDLGLSDADAGIEVVVGQGRVDDFVAVEPQDGRFKPPGVDCQPSKKIFIAISSRISIGKS